MKNFEELELLIANHPNDFTDVLEKEYFIRHRVNPDNPNQYVFKYEQGLSPEDSPITKECRGTCVEVIPGKYPKVICAGFLRFYNHWKVDVIDKIDWPSAEAQEKLDGQCIKFWKQNGKAHWNSNGAFGVNSESMSMRTPSVPTYEILLQLAIGDDSWTKNVPDGWTLIFELCSSFNVIVCHYNEIKLWLIGARDPEGNEHKTSEIKEMFGLSYDIPRTYPVHSLEEAINLVKDWKAYEQEGVVICDKYFHRIKVKAPAYLDFVKSNMDLGGGPNAIFKMVMNGTYKQFDDVNPGAFDAYRDLIDQYEKELFEFTKASEDAFIKIKEWQNKYYMFSEKEQALYFKAFLGTNKAFSTILDIIKWNDSYESYKTDLIKNKILDYGKGKHGDGTNHCRKRFLAMQEAFNKIKEEFYLFDYD